MKNTKMIKTKTQAISNSAELENIEFSLINEGLGFHQKNQVSPNRARDIAIQASHTVQTMSTSQPASLNIENDQLAIFYKNTTTANTIPENTTELMDTSVDAKIKMASFFAAVMMDLSIVGLIYFLLNLIISITLSSFISFNFILSHFLNENYLMLPLIYFFYNTFYIRVTHTTLGFRSFKMRFVSFNGKEDFSYSLLCSAFLLCNILSLGILQLMSLQHIFRVAVVYERN
jgi:hypothetical protein